MILDCGVFHQWRQFSRPNFVCLASPAATAVHLRHQLDSLHKEADTTRAKASNARLRLMRLSEAVDKLRRQAVTSVQTGKENDSREMLFQKKKVMQAIEKLKTRIQLFDELSAKLNEAISMKENLLVENMALDLEVTEDESPGQVRIVSPTVDDTSISDHTDNSDLESNKEQQTLQDFIDDQVNLIEENELMNHESSSSSIENGSKTSDAARSLKEITTYEDFVEHLDKQLAKIEQELESFLRFSNLLLDSIENSKVQHATQVLEDVRHARDRIATIIKQAQVNSDNPQL